MSEQDNKPAAALEDEHHLRAGAALVRRAAREGWGISVEKKKATVDRLCQIVAKTSVEVATMDGLVQDTASADRNAVAAAKTLVAIDAIDQTDHWNEDKNQRLDAGKMTERVGTDAVILRQAIIATPGTKEITDGES